ncbi:MAG: DegT/DnrJ/EryC1/StrS family aminotransferase [Firmicutes bacterium]|nr:DegT/DnrJ/EryC1/StrS family aminotransferase [Bacillota bacterium]
MLSFPKWPIADESDLKLIREADIRDRARPMSKRFSDAFRDFTKAPYVLPVANGTVSLELILTALGVGPGDEVILPPYTFIATFSSIIYTGATPVFADIEPDTYNLSPVEAEKKITSKTKAIVAVAVAGRPFDLDAFEQLAKDKGLYLIVDAAQAVGATWNGRDIATYGTCASFSCQNTKNLTCGEGGIITTSDENLYQKLCDMVEKKDHRLNEISCALLISQLSRLSQQMKKRAESARYLNEGLSRGRLVLPMKQDPRITLDAYHLFVLRTRVEELAKAGRTRKDLIRDARELGLPLLAGYEPLYRLPSVQSATTRKLIRADMDLSPLPVCERASYEEGLWLEQFTLLSEKETLDQILQIFETLERRYFG